MEKKQNQSKQAATSRQEKLSLLSTILGPEALAKLSSDGVSKPVQPPKDMKELDPKRAEWHRNRLMERFRLSSGETSTQANSGSVSVEGKKDAGLMSPKPTGIDDRLNHIGIPKDLSREHPAVIAHILSKLPRADRVVTIKSLPGPIARAVVRRIR